MAATRRGEVARIKEFFRRYDKSGDGELSITEVSSALKGLRTLSDEEVARLCGVLDKTKDGIVSCKEFVEWSMQGEESRAVKKAILAQTGDLRTARIKRAFQSYDKSGDGSLNLQELEATLKALGSFTNPEVKAICADLDKNNDGEISFREFATWICSASGNKSIQKAKAILAPGDDDGLQASFYRFCETGHADMNGKSFVKMCRDCNLFDSNLTEATLDLLFNNVKVKPKGQRSIDFPQFEIALELVARKKGIPLDDLRDVLLAAIAPKLQGTKSDDVRLYKEDKSSTSKGRTRGKLFKPTKSSMVGQLEAARQETLRTLKEANAMQEYTTVQDQRQLFRVFGTDNKAGLTLKKLYEPDFKAPERSTSMPALSKRLMASTQCGSFLAAPRRDPLSLTQRDPFLLTRTEARVALPPVHMRWETHLQLQGATLFPVPAK